MRLNYLQGGGSDQSILNKFTELEFDVRTRNPTQFQRRSSQQNYSQNQIGKLFILELFNCFIIHIIKGLSRSF